MDAKSRVTRRAFFRLCASAVSLVAARPSLLASTGGTLHEYHRVLLVNAAGDPLRPRDLPEGENYIFHYPYVSTPCFLLNLGQPVPGQVPLQTEDGHGYTWQGGVGPEKSVVAFSAICSHRMSHPSRDFSFINYRHRSTRFVNLEKSTAVQDKIIYCCSENSVYDPVRGGRVLGGPAPQPLTTIVLQYDSAEDALYAVGTHGGEMYQKFFEQFGPRLAIEFRATELSEIRRQIAGSAPVVPLRDYTSNQVLC